MIETIPVEVEEAKEQWSEYHLSDGTVLRVKAVLVDVARQANQFSPDGEPIYHVKFAPVVAVRAPDALKKPAN